MADYPIRVRARLDEPLSRWLWLVKWLLAIPHYIVLYFLWVAYCVLTVIAFFAILFTGRYPRSIFDFNVGVMRWTWRVAYYSYAALGTDRYPPFTLAEVPDYPTTLTVDYPERMSRGLVLVKWWLLAIPHYIVLGLMVGAAYTFTANNDVVLSTPGGLIGLLVFFAAIVLLFVGRYPRGVFDFVMGMNRWALRVAAYASLMTDAYPPFRLDSGPDEPAGPAPVPTPPETAAVPAATAATAAEPTAGPAVQPAPSGWSVGRVLSVVAGSLLLVIGLGSAGGAAVTAWADQVARDDAGYVSGSTERLTADGYALRYDALQITSEDWGAGDLDWLGTVRVRATGSPEVPVFVGIARTTDVDRYLNQTTTYRDRWSDMTGPGPRWQQADRPVAAPVDQTFWVESSNGIGEQSLAWDATAGDWTLVVMNADATRGVDADVNVGATLPILHDVWIGMLIVAGIALIGGALAVTLAIVGARSPETRA